MLLAGLRQFNLVLCTALVLAVAPVVHGDEVRRWRDAQGKLHLSITGTPEAETEETVSSEDAAMSPEQRFSVDTSLRRRDLEKRLRAATSELARVRKEMEEVRVKHLVVYSPPAPADPADAQFALDAQRNAFLQARVFERDKADRLKKLRRQERDWLREILTIWDAFGSLRVEVRTAYGALPPWWRDRLDCPGCPTAAEAEKALKPASRPSEESLQQGLKRTETDDDETAVVEPGREDSD